jgi:hypothetical protein
LRWNEAPKVEFVVFKISEAPITSAVAEVKIGILRKGICGALKNQ